MFEPTIDIEISGRRAFSSLHSPGAKPVVVMAFREDALQETRRLLSSRDRHPDGEDDWRLWFHGTGCGLNLRREAGRLNVTLEIDPGFGPTSNLTRGRYPMGRIELQEWVQAVVDVSRELSDLFRRGNPALFKEFQDQELWIQELESWLAIQES